MDNNKIHIDDFVRQRLEGGEEEERAGEWLKMRDLLDDKMPPRPVAFGWRRMFAPAVGLLLFASLGVGGYSAYNTWKNNNNAVVGNTIVSSSANHSIATTMQADEKTNALESNTEKGYEQITISTKNRETAALNNGATNTNTSSTKTPTLKPSQKNTLTQNAAIASNAKTENKTVATLEKGNQQLLKPASQNPNATNHSQAKTTHTINKANQHSVAATAMKHQNNVAQHTAANTTASSPTTTTTQSNNSNGLPQAKYAANAQPTTVLSETVAAKQTVLNTTNKLNTAPSSLSSNTTVSKKEMQSLAKNQPQSGSNHFNKKAGQQQPSVEAIKKDSIEKMFVTQRATIDPITRSAVFTSDTVRIEKMPAPQEWQEKALASNNLVLNSNVASENKLEAKRKTNKHSASQSWGGKLTTGIANWFDRESLNDKIVDAKYKLSQVKFYPGITLGMNSYLFGPSSMMGIQAGVRGVTVFSERWSMLTELKYVQRFNQSCTVKDNYWQIGNISGNSYDANEVEHYFNFSTLKSLELPVAVRYMYNKLVAFAGVNIVYNFKVNVDEITHAFESQTYSGNSFNLKTIPSVQLKDFGERFSAGYMLGLGYEVASAIEIDARMTQNFWDNATGTGARKVSQSLLYNPAFQLSINFRFNQKNRIPKAR